MGEENKLTEEARLSKLEAEVGHVVSSINVLSSTVQKGFEETRSMISDVHERVNDHERESERMHRVNPSLILSFISIAILVGGVFVAFVNMRVNPVIAGYQRDLEWREKIEILRDQHVRELMNIHNREEEKKEEGLPR